MRSRELRSDVVGITVFCAVCARAKGPLGRSVPIESSMCNSSCKGYDEEPFVGSLWPGESEFDFGYEVGPYGTRRRV